MAFFSSFVPRQPSLRAAMIPKTPDVSVLYVDITQHCSCCKLCNILCAGMRFSRMSTVRYTLETKNPAGIPSRLEEKEKLMMAHKCRNGLDIFLMPSRCEQPILVSYFILGLFTGRPYILFSRQHNVNARQLLYVDVHLCSCFALFITRVK